MICKMEGEPDWCEERVLEILPDLNCTELGNLCLELGLTVDEKIKGNRTQVYKFIMKHFLELEAAEGEHGKAKFVQVYKYLKLNYLDAKVVDDTKKEEPLTTHQLPEKLVGATGGGATENKAPNVDFSQFLVELTKALASGGDHKQLANLLQQKMTGTNEPSPANKSVSIKPAMVMKELKFKGIIGGEEVVEKDRLTFSSLCYQIRNAQKIGHQEQTICDAILTAISPSNHLKTFFEMRPQLSIISMLGKLKNFYKEKDYTETLLELSHTAQSSRETCLGYCTRLMCLRDKVILLSIEEGCPQDLGGLSKTFMKSVFVGMRNANVRNELRESCKNLYKDPNNADKDDDELMNLISEAMANETARTDRLKEAKEIEVSLMQTNTANKEKEKSRARSVSFSDKNDKPSYVTQLEELRIQQKQQGEALAALVAQVVEIRDVVVADRANNSSPDTKPKPLIPQQQNPSLLPPPPVPPQNYPPQQQNQFGNQPPNPPAGQYQQQYVPPHRRLCARCTRENRYRCFHCFHCGSDSHKIFECPTKN